MTVAEKHDQVIDAVIARLKSFGGTKAIVGDRVGRNGEIPAPAMPRAIVLIGRCHVPPSAGAKQLVQVDVLVEVQAETEDVLPTLATGVQHALCGWKQMPLVHGGNLTDTQDTLPIEGGFSRRQLFGLFTTVPE